MQFKCFFALASLYLMAWIPTIRPAELPTARQVIEKYIQARRGFETLESRTNIHFRSHGTSTNGSPFVYEAYQAEGMFHAQFIYEDGRTIERGVHTDSELTSSGERDGIAWERINENAIREITGAERQEYLRRRSCVSSATRWLDSFKSIDCKSIERINNREAYKLHFVDQDDSELDRYFDTETGLCIRRVAVEEFNNRQQTVIRDYLDYRRIGELLVPTKHIAHFDNIQYVYEIELYEVDVRIPKGIFDVPRTIAPKVAMTATQRRDTNK